MHQPCWPRASKKIFLCCILWYLSVGKQYIAHLYVLHSTIFPGKDISSLHKYEMLTLYIEKFVNFFPGLDVSRYRYELSTMNIWTYEVSTLNIWTYEVSTLNIVELVELFPESSAACQLLWDSLPLLRNFCKFLQFARLNSFTGCFVTHLHFLPPLSFPNCKSAPFLPLNCFGLVWKTNMLPSFGFSPQIAGEVSCWHFWFVNWNSARFLTQQNCGLLWATSVARFHLSALWQLNKSQRGWLGQQICNCKSVFLAPGSDLWVGVVGQQI